MPHDQGGPESDFTGSSDNQVISDYITSENPSDVAKGLAWLADVLDEQVGNIRLIATKVGRVDSPLGRLILAMASPLLDKDALFPKRLEKLFSDKQALTSHYAKNVLDTQERVFLESGSMTAVLALAYHEIAAKQRARQAHNDVPHLKQICTNNRAVADVLCSLCRVWQTPGWADTKYFGVFPFASSNDDIHTDQKHFRDLYFSLKDNVDRLVLDASMFSFLLGPTVQSWQNVCYKAVAYNVQKPIDVLIETEKVITEVGDPNETDVKHEKRTLCWHLTHCYTVFKHPSLGDGVSTERVMPDMGSLTMQEGRGIAFFENIADDLQLKKTWLDLVESNRNIRIWVVSSRKDEHSRIEEHIRCDLNPYLKALGRTVFWENEVLRLRCGDAWVTVYKPSALAHP